jgi:hypothetical protein
MDETPPAVEAVVVRYEELVTDLAGVAARIGEWLGVELDADAVLAQRSDYAHHVTADSVNASIGRWRNDLAPGEASQIARALGPRLTAYAYQL